MLKEEPGDIAPKWKAGNFVDSSNIRGQLKEFGSCALFNICGCG
jgi:hypothetical protein